MPYFTHPTGSPRNRPRPSNPNYQSNIGNQFAAHQGAQIGQAAKDAVGAIHDMQMQDPKFRITAMQRFLNHRGYNIAIDGVRGPETNAAVAAFHNHVKADVWNNRNKAKPGAGGGGGPTTGPIDDTPGATAAQSVLGAPGMDVPNIPLINPQQYARSAANEQYNPQIGALQQQEKDSKTRYAQNDTDIQSWYAQLMGDVNKYTAQDSAATRDSLAGVDSANANTLQLFGGPGANDSADEAAAFQGIDRTALASIGLAQGNYDRDIAKSTALGGAQARTANRRAGSTELADLASQLLGVRGAKGQAYNTNLYAGLQAQTQQASALQSMKLAAQLAPAQQATALAQAQGAITDAGAAPAKNAVALKNAQLQNKQLQTQIDAAKSGNNWNLQNDRTQRGQFESAIRASSQTPGGTFKVSPDVTWKNIQGVLEQEGLTDSPYAQAIAASIMQETIRNSHAKRMWGMYNFNGKKVVKNGKPFPKK